MKKVGLYFGTFNPIHVGHLVIANYMAEYTELDEIWLIVSPQNPLKKSSELLNDRERLALVQEAVKDNNKLKVNDVEFDMPKPSYTVDTLKELRKIYPELEFALIMGEDNLRTLYKWKGYEEILSLNDLYVYPRILTDQEQSELNEIGHQDHNLNDHPRVKMCDAPVMKVSATFIRNAIKEQKDVRYLLTETVHRYLKDKGLYTN